MVEAVKEGDAKEVANSLTNVAAVGAGTLDDNLREYMAAGKVVLFLGAGCREVPSRKMAKQYPTATNSFRKYLISFWAAKLRIVICKAVRDFPINRKSQRELQEFIHNLTRIIGKLNPTYSYDQEVIYHLVRTSAPSDLIPDRVKGVALYELALSAFGEIAGLLHQCGLYEVHKAGDASGLDRAEQLVGRALEKEPRNRAIQHSQAEIALKRSRLATTDAEQDMWRQRAIALAHELANRGTSAFPFHTMATASADGVAAALRRYEEDPDELAELAVDEAIRKAEDIHRRSLRASRMMTVCLVRKPSWRMSSTMPTEPFKLWSAPSSTTSEVN